MKVKKESEKIELFVSMGKNPVLQKMVAKSR
jgi:hypothetical protein